MSMNGKRKEFNRKAISAQQMQDQYIDQADVVAR